MSILQEIQKWSLTLPGWQQDTIARLYANSELAVEDYDDLYALLKAEHGIPDPEKRTPGKLAAERVAAPQAADRLVQLTSIKNLRNVNALAEGEVLDISPTGLTVIYGENGTGKSGYSRVLKKACRARDQREPVLPNAHKERALAGPAQAAFDLCIDGEPVEVEWTDKQAAPEQLSAIAILDTHCARAYVDNQGDFAYSPYGLDILEGLVKVCGKLRPMATKEHGESQPNLELFSALLETATVVGQLLSRLSAKTRPEDVEALGTLTEAEQLRLDALNKTLAEADPKQKAQVLRLRANRFETLSARIREAVGLVDYAKVVDLQILVARSNAAKAAAELAARQFLDTPGLLPGTGGEAWKALFEAARTFAGFSHADREFPHLGEDAACPLCQNRLGEAGAGKLAAFDAFVQQEAEKVAKEAREAAMTAYNLIRNANVDISIDEALAKELEDCLPDLARACAEVQATLNARKAAILKAAFPEGDWDAIPPFVLDPRVTLDTVSRDLNAEAKALEDSMDEQAKTAMVLEQTELEARRRLSELKPAVLDAIAKFILVDKLKACIDGTGTTTISRKSTELARNLATPEVLEALNGELRRLGVHELRVVMKNESTLGRTQFKLALELPGGGTPSAILSEGEQRAIAIASFLAEVRLGNGSGGVVFDDPVSSLDHLRREHVARRIAAEALDRQVIVFTHDLYFLNVLVHEARSIGVDPACRSLRRASVGYGVADDTLPFEGASTKDRVGMLRQMRVACERFHKAGDERGYRREVRDTYAHLRMAWERAVEEILFNSVVLRFRKGVETNRLSRVVVGAEDVKTIQENMGKCSNYTGHDGALDAIVGMPSPEELHADIEALEEWRKGRM